MLNVVFIFLMAVFFSITLAAFFLTLFRKEIVLNQRITKYFGDGINKDFQTDKVKPRLFSGVSTRYWVMGTNYLQKKVSRASQRKLDQMLRDAGYPFKSAIDFRLFQLVMAFGGGIIVAFLYLPIIENKMMGWMLAGTVGVLGYRLPIFYLGKKTTARIKEINKQMPDFFDTVNLLLEAGMGLDLALADVSRKMEGPLADEFRRTLEDMKLGMSRREAFYELKKRVPSDSFQSVINSLIQADQLGIGMAKVLRNLTNRVREQRKEAAREQAMKAPVKMLFPMVFFIFPSLFIVILGPLVITLVTKGLGG